jgi:outer membrane protein
MKQLVAFLFMVLFATSPALAADMKIGVVDLQRAMATSKSGIELSSAFNAEVKAYETKLREKEDELKKLSERFSKDLQENVLTEEALSAKEAELKQKDRDYGFFKKDNEEKLRQRQSKLSSQLVQNFALLTKEIATQEGYDFIFEVGSLIYVAPTADLTDKLIAAADSKQAKKKDK